MLCIFCPNFSVWVTTEELLVTGHSAVSLEDMENDPLPTSISDISFAGVVLMFYSFS